MADRGTRLSENWQPSEETIRWAKQRRPDLDVVDQIESFRDYWLSKTGAGATKLDWTRTFRNWIRNARYQWKPQRQEQPAPRVFHRATVVKNEEQEDANRGKIGNLLANLFGSKS